jgi:F-type H+-transporting ATPase subunit gamma
MAQTQTIKRRMRSVRNAGQITKALEVVAASRMRRIQQSVSRVRLYAQAADSIMRRIAPSQEAKLHPYFNKGAGQARLYIIFNSDRGQAGAFNSNIFAQAHKSFIQDKSEGYSSDIVVFGRKGTSHFARLAGVEMVGAYEDIADIPEVNVFAAALDTIQTGFDQGRYESVHMIYTLFKSSLVQQVTQIQLLPISVPQTENSDTNSGAKETVYEFEPSIESVLEEAMRIYFEASFISARVESAASEHSMRMIAMGNANRNARDLVDDLTLELNSVRQAAITQEIAEITGGAQAVNV